MSLKKTISWVCKGHSDLFLIRFVQVYMKLKGTNNTRGDTTSPPGVKRCIDPTQLDSGCCEMRVFTTTWGQLISPRSGELTPHKIRTVLTLFARSLNGNPTT